MSTDTGSTNGTPDSDTGTTPPAPTQPDGQAPDRNADVAAANAEAARYRRELRGVQAELDRVKLANASDAERAIAEAKAQGASEYQAKWRQAVLNNAALAALADKRVTAIEPALRSLDLSDIEITDDGRVDAGQVKAKVDAFLEQYPMFVSADAGPPALPTLTGDQQRGVPPGNRVRPNTDQTESLLRYGLGG